MQKSCEFFLDTCSTLGEASIESILFPLVSGEIIFFSGDLGSGKSTFIRALLRAHFRDENLIVRSPTYTYYQKYGNSIYHFDLYRVGAYDDLMLIGALDILQDPHAICLIEWPEILEGRIIPDRKITIIKVDDMVRKYTIEFCSRK